MTFQSDLNGLLSQVILLVGYVVAHLCLMIHKGALLDLFTFEPHRENTGFLHMRKQRRRSASRNKDAYQLHGNHEADKRLCFRCIDSPIPLLPIYKISSL